MRYFFPIFIFVFFSSNVFAGYYLSTSNSGDSSSACWADKPIACGRYKDSNTYFNGTIGSTLIEGCGLSYKSNNNPAGYARLYECTLACSSGKGRNPSSGECVSCPTGATQDASTGACVCPSGTHLSGGACVQDCSASDQQAWAAATAPYNHKVHVTNAPITAGLRVVNETTTNASTCENTCRIDRTTFVRIGNITNVSYEIKDWIDAENTGMPCTSMPAGSTVTTQISIGTKEEGGCRSGFSYGEINGVPGCYGAPSGMPNGQAPSNGGSAGNNGGRGDDGSIDTSDSNSDGSCPAGYSPMQLGGRVVCGKASSTGSGGNTGGQGGESDVPSHTTSTAHTFGEAASNFATGIKDTPVARAIGGMSSIFPSGSGACPTPGFDVFGRHFVIDFHCTLFALVASTLSALMMVVWTFLGLRIIASA